MKKLVEIFYAILIGLLILGALVLAQAHHLLPFSIPFLSEVTLPGIDAPSSSASPDPSPTPIAAPESGAPSSPIPTLDPADALAPSPVPSVSPSPLSSSSPIPGGEVASSGVTSPSPVPSGENNPALDKQSKANIEIFREMYEVTLITEVKNIQQIQSWVNTLNQGASLEGVYHGLVQSTEYVNLVKKSPPASPEAVKLFIDEMDELKQEIPDRIQNKDPAPKNASIYVYKRILGEEALKVFDHKNLRTDQTKVAMWYARMATRLARKKVNFGLELRNKLDLNFHQNWAVDAFQRKAEEQLKWEILNRLHRILNEANKAPVETNRKEP